MDFLKRPPLQQRFLRLLAFFRSLPGQALRRLKGLGSGLGRLGKGALRLVADVFSIFRNGDWKTRLSFLVMGFGSFCRGQWLRGGLFFLFQTVFNLYMFLMGFAYLGKLPTLGTVETRKIGRQTIYGDHSFFILLYGVLTIFFMLAFLYTWYVNIRQNKISQQLAAEGKALATARQDLTALMDRQFHKTLLALPTLGVTLFTILPILFMVLVAFTNYDARHQPPQNLFQWVGTENFRTLLSANQQPLALELGQTQPGSLSLRLYAPNGDVITAETDDLAAARAAAALCSDPSAVFAYETLPGDACRLSFQNDAGVTISLQAARPRFASAPSYARTFRQVLLWTLIWAFFATFLNYFLGMLVALAINRRGIRFKKMWRTVLVITIAVPQFISLLYLSKMFAADGLINGLMMRWGWIQSPLPFWTDPTWARITIILINIWVGIPYLMLIATGILMNIPKDLYESARMDGANAFQIYRKITLPYMLFVTGPYLLTSFTANINNFNVIFLLSQGAPLSLEMAGNAGSTDLLITWLYKMTVTDSNYKLAAVIGILVFVVCALINLTVYNLIPSVKHEEDFQ